MYTGTINNVLIGVRSFLVLSDLMQERRCLLLTPVSINPGSQLHCVAPWEVRLAPRSVREV